MMKHAGRHPGRTVSILSLSFRSQAARSGMLPSVVRIHAPGRNCWKLSMTPMVKSGHCNNKNKKQAPPEDESKDGPWLHSCGDMQSRAKVTQTFACCWFWRAVGMGMGHREGGGYRPGRVHR